jgi:hypothetical protein
VVQSLMLPIWVQDAVQVTNPEELELLVVLDTVDKLDVADVVIEPIEAVAVPSSSVLDQ